MRTPLALLMSSLLINAVHFEVIANNELDSKKDSLPELLLHVPSPEWQDQVIYFLMTDRFDDGDSTNNDQGHQEYNPNKGSYFSGGDIQGVIDQLDYIQNLGATAVWTTPVVANQWRSSSSKYGGYHGYWAVDFSSVDAHLGDMKTYQQLSDNLHRRGMYLIKDIVVNHTGSFFNYKGGIEGYDPQNTAKNFYLTESMQSAQPYPTQVPFNFIDRNNPEHNKASIYNWTPSIMDYDDLSQQYTYQLAGLADINTKNPVVIDRFKQIYGDWIKNAGVDSFRIDTVRYVENGFFHHFMHDQDGIHAAAKSTGREDFLVFGEVFDTSEPYKNDAEHRVASYHGSADKPELNSLISFPLHKDLKTVFAQGFPTDHLAYRIEQHMAVYENPYIIPTFIDNHDMSRFLASGNVHGFKQALMTIFTIPGIPTIYQGSEQGFTETRQAMFKGGFMANKDYFNQTSELYKFISKLAKLRTSDRLFTRGSFEVVASNKTGPGLLAYKREYQGRTVLVMLNTSPQSILVNNIKVADYPATLRNILGEQVDMSLNNQGYLTTQLPSRSMIIAELEPNEISHNLLSSKIIIETPNVTEPVLTRLELSGKSDLPNSSLLVVKNTTLNKPNRIHTDAQGNWQYTYPVENLGSEQVSLVVYHPETGTTSKPFTFNTSVASAQHSFFFKDAKGDDNGLTGRLTPPTHSQSIGQQDILSAKAEIGGEVLKLTLTMKQLTNDWIPANGFDNVAFSIFFDLENVNGSEILPMLNADMPQGWNWDLGNVIYGWGNTAFSNKGADAHIQGERLGIAPSVRVNKEAKTITFSYRASDFDVDSWINSNIYITTWDITGEGAYRDLNPSASAWSFGGGKPDQAKILDYMKISLRNNGQQK